MLRGVQLNVSTREKVKNTPHVSAPPHRRKKREKRKSPEFVLVTVGKRRLDHADQQVFAIGVVGFPVSFFVVGILEKLLLDAEITHKIREKIHQFFCLPEVLETKTKVSSNNQTLGDSGERGINCFDCPMCLSRYQMESGCYDGLQMGNIARVSLLNGYGS